MEPTINDSGSWSMGVLVGLPFLALFIIVMAGVLVVGARYADRSSSYGWSDRRLIVTWSIPVLVIGVAISTAAFYPFGGEYHQFREVSGTVDKIDSRLLKDAETKFVVRFDGSAQQFGCDDTRCASVEAGDTLTLSCKRAWQYTGTDGYDCRFVSNEAAK